MIKNYIDVSYLKTFHPELNEYLFAGETDYTDEINTAEQIVMSDLMKRDDLDVRKLRPELNLDITTGIEDIGSRSRVVYNITNAPAGTKSIDILGCNTVAGDYVSCGSQSITGSGQGTFLLTSLYSFYKYELTNCTADEVYLVEQVYDLLYTYKVFEIIFRASRKEKEDKFDLLAEDYNIKYTELLDSMSFWYDTSGDGDLIDTERTSSNKITYHR